MAVKHAFSNAKADGADATLTRPSDWNADHNHVPFEILLLGEGSTAQGPINLAAGFTEWVAAPKARTKADLTFATQARIVARQGAVAAAGSSLRVWYSTDQTTWVQLGSSADVSVALSSATANAAIAGSFQAIASGAKADVWLRLEAGGGDGVADPTIYSVSLQVK